MTKRPLPQYAVFKTLDGLVSVPELLRVEDGMPPFYVVRLAGKASRKYYAATSKSTATRIIWTYREIE